MDAIVGAVAIGQDKVFFTCSDGNVYALDAETGDYIWEFATGDKVWATPVYDAGTLYVGSFDKNFYALNAEDGTEIWQFEAEGVFASTPLVDNGTVYIGTLDRYFYAINAADGTLQLGLAYAKTGSGKILGVFRTIPAPAREIVEQQLALLREVSIGGVYALGNTSEPLCQIPVALNRIGVVQLGGLNPIAAAVEAGIDIENIAESGLIDFQQLKSVWQL